VEHTTQKAVTTQKRYESIVKGLGPKGLTMSDLPALVRAQADAEDAL